MSFINNVNRRSGPTKHWTWSLIYIVWYPASVFAKNWLYYVRLLELWGYINFVNFTNSPRAFGGHCIWSSVSNVFANHHTIAGQQIDSFQNANFLISQPNTMMLPLNEIVSPRQFQWGSHHRVWLRNEKVIMKTVLFTIS